ncbi:MAG: TonB family protein [Deltaproteobacteria bacterium]|nr:TonB family protein [Deltaproteobacteria bacterium]
MRSWGLLIAAGMLAVGCGGGGATRKRERPLPVPPAPRFNSGPAAGPEPVLPLDKPHRAWLSDVGDLLRSPWSAFVDQASGQLPPDHELNRADLEVVVELELSARGQRLGARVAKESGSQDFDDAALEIVTSLPALPPPPADAISDDGRCRLRWRFARDARRAAPAGAEVEVREFDVATATRKFLEVGRLRDAVGRLSRALDSGAATVDSGPGLVASRMLATAVLASRIQVDAGPRCIGEGCAARPDLFAVASAVRDLGEGGAMDAAPLIARHIDGAAALRSFAIEALGRLSYQAAQPRLVELLPDATLGPTAARALARLGAEASDAGVRYLEPYVMRKASARLIETLGALESKAAVAQLLAAIKSGSVMRIAAWQGLTAPLYAPVTDADEPLRKAMLAGAADGDAKVRVAVLGAIQRWGAAERIPKGAVNLVISALGDKDASVRAAAVGALMEVGSSKWLGELGRASRDKSPLPARALAAALARRPGRAADANLWLTKLAASADAETKRQARAAQVLAGVVSLADALTATADDAEATRVLLSALAAAQASGQKVVFAAEAAAAVLTRADVELRGLGIEVLARGNARRLAADALLGELLSGAADPAAAAAAWLRATK